MMRFIGRFLYDYYRLFLFLVCVRLMCVGRFEKDWTRHRRQNKKDDVDEIKR